MAEPSRICALEAIQRYLEIRDPVSFGRGEVAGADVDLDRGDQQGRRAERPVARGPQGHELVLALAREVDVALALLGHGRLPARLAATGLVVVADEEAGLGGQGEGAAGAGGEGGGGGARDGGPR